MSRSKLVLNWSKPEITRLDEKFHFGQYVIRVLNKHEKYEALKWIIMSELFEAKNDPIINALLFDKISIKSLKRWIKKHLKQNIAYGCFLTAKEGNTKKEIKMVAVDVLYVRNMRDEFKPSKDSGKAFVNFITYIIRIEKHLWSLGAQQTCNILSSFGIFISNDSKEKTRIAVEMIKNRKKMAKALQIRILGAALIGAEIQKAAEKVKYDVIYHFTKDDCKELGLGYISQQEFIPLNTVFPIMVMGFKLPIKTAKPTVAELIEKTTPFSKKIKKEEL